MNLDMHRILEGWPYEPGQVTARRIIGDDAREKLQLRLDLGVIQMEIDGRPDGQRPYGHESLLDYYETRLRRYETENGTDEDFGLDSAACELLRAEGTMYYHRYIAAFVLEDWHLVERDTLRNLRLFDFCEAYANDEQDRYILEQYRAYVIMMCTRARARLALEQGRPRAALGVVHKGIDAIRHSYERWGQERSFGSSGEVAVLKTLARDIEKHSPLDPLQLLQRRLAKALQEERYEEAALIRDKLQKFKMPKDASDVAQFGAAIDPGHVPLDDR